MIDCVNCAAAQSNKVWGGYLMSCVNCCARLVRSARPWREAQEAMLAVAARHGHGKDAVLLALKTMGPA